MNFKKVGLCTVLSLVLTGCAATYTPPVTTGSNLITGVVQANKYEVIVATQKVLAVRGDQVQNINESLGIISTQPKAIKLTPDMADCGKTMGLDYLKDNRTSSKIHFNIMVDNNKISIKGIPTAEYKVGAIDQDMTLTCVSKGVLEQRLLSEIKQSL